MASATRLTFGLGRVFATTRWTVIAACSQADETLAQSALAELCHSYWQPVYICIRHDNHSAHDAEDLTQEFFLRLLKGKWIKHLDQAKGRFRAYLSVALHNFLHDQRRRRWTLRRGGGSTAVAFDAAEAENRYIRLPATETTPETLYERQWARAVVAHALELLHLELQANGKQALFAHFEAILMANTRQFPYQDVAKSMGLTVGTLHVALHRCRQRFYTLMREEIARTVVSKSEIEDELQHLQRVFAQDV